MSGRARKRKIGRNDPCPCGSGQKYKRCHGAAARAFQPIAPAPPLSHTLKAKLAELQARQLQREQQQGLGRPIISAVFKGYRLVAVGSRLHYSKSWKTFHDFLFDYIKLSLGEAWGNAELKKAEAERHPILRWYGLLCKYQKETMRKPTGVHTAPMTGAVEAYIGLAYNLYLLAHNAELQARLLKRLKDASQFHGACYETYVAAAFIKAGFRVELENEADPSRTHCEFIATYPPTGRRFSVEAKARQPGKASVNVGNQLYAALQKNAHEPRVVFVDVNVPDAPSDRERVAWLEEALASIRSKEASMTIDGQPAPSAYVFLTNHPYQYSLESTEYRWVVVSEGFKISDYKLESTFRSIREALVARDRHHEMFHLMKALRSHYEIPSTFDGEIPEFAFDGSTPRLRIGNKYLVPTETGAEVPGTLVDVTVSEKEAIAYGAYTLDDGRSIIATSPLTEEELAAYRRHPDTVFGVHRPQGRRIDDPLELFDWFFDIYRHTPKDRLLEFMSDRPDIDDLSSKDQRELAISYCEGLVYAAVNSNKGMQATASGGA
jgi:hypothetical protein